MVLKSLSGFTSRGKSRACIVPILALLLILGCSTPRNEPMLTGPDIPGFDQDGPLIVYNRLNLFDYIDGEAEVYLPFGFRILYVLSIRSRDNDSVMIMDTYDMGTPEGAKGVFERFISEGGSPIQGIGASARAVNGGILFIRDRYFLRVFPDPSPESKIRAGLPDMTALSRAVDRLLAGL